jgi:two-component system response regulator RegX3
MRRGTKQSSSMSSVLLAMSPSPIGNEAGETPISPVVPPSSVTPVANGSERQRPAVDRQPLRRVPEEILEVGDVQLDVSRHECVVRTHEVKLPLKEFELLEILLANAGRVVTRDNLIDRVWGLDYVGDTKTLDVHIKRLRSRIEADPARPVLITTIRGVGYRFEAPRR